MFIVILLLELILGQEVKNISIFADYPHKIFAGYINEQYYMYFESQQSPNDPLIVWLQGGPGCSSLFGMFYEIGPIQFKPLSNETYINPYAWNLQSNLLFIESPDGVGFSQTKAKLDENTTAQNLLETIKQFVKQYNMSKHEVYLSGESYAGIYIPYLAQAILNDGTVNLKGLLIGNGCTLGAECTDPKMTPLGFSQFQFEQLFNRAFFSLDDRLLYSQVCAIFSSDQCYKLQKQLLDKVNWNRVDIDNINGYCYHNDPTLQNLNGGFKKQTHFKKYRHLFVSNKEMFCNYEAGDFFFFNNRTIQQQLHVNASKIWQSCTPDFNYHEDEQGSYRLYQQLLPKLKIWIYSGDVDANVPITGTMTWFQMLTKNMTETDPWRLWFINSKLPQVGGVTWQFGTIRFLSVRNAGHEVPFWQPEAAYALYEGFLKNTI